MLKADSRRVLKLFGLVCSRCKGTRAEPNGKGLNVSSFCTRCKGASYSIEEATRSNWPWWRTKISVQSSDPRTSDPLGDLNEPYVPDFTTDPGACVRLAEEMGGQFQFIPIVKRWWANYNRMDICESYAGTADTLGQAQLNALEAASGKREGAETVRADWTSDE